MKRLPLVAAAFFLACEPPRPVSRGPGCHWVECADLIGDGFDGNRCNVSVDGRVVANVATGQDALDFIRRNGLRTCEVKP